MSTLLSPSITAVDDGSSDETVSSKGAAKRPTGSRRRRPPKSRTGKSRQDTGLVFILAQQTILRWEFAATRFRSLTQISAENSLKIEAELGLAQLRSMIERLQPFVRSRNLAIRFETEELLVRLNLLTETLLQAQLLITGGQLPSRMMARQIQDRLMAKFRGARRSS